MPNITERKKQRTELRFAPTVLANYRAAAESVGISLNSWLMMAAASYYSKWATPDQARQRRKLPSNDTVGMLCVICGVEAKACRNPSGHKAMLWEEE